MPVRIWIDTDIGSDVDDALALAYALRHPELEVVGVSTVFGDVELRSRIARELVRRAGASDVPVVTGLGAPLSPGRNGRMFGHEGRGLFEDPSPRMETPVDPDPAGRIDELRDVLASRAPDALVAIGPLTNLGALAESGVALPALTIMGGKVRDVMLPGMTPAISEWNWYCDPVAVQRVLACSSRSVHRVVPAEVTFRTYLHAEDVERLESGDPLARALSVLCGHWLSALRSFGSPNPRVALHDPLAVATLVEPGLSPFERALVRVDSHGAAHRDPAGTEIEVACDVDNDALRRHLLATWIGT